MIEQVRILIVEGEGITAMDISDQLQHLGYVVLATVFSAKEALRKTEELHPDVVLMDVQLKGKVDGIEAAKQIRARFDVPVIYVTADADEATLQQAKMTEPVGYVLKPFEERPLRSAIETAIYKHTMERRRLEFLSMLSHDIRNPLGVLLGYAEMLDEALHSRDMTEVELLLQRLSTTAHSVYALVTNYLDFSRLKAGQLSLLREPVQLDALVLRLVRQYETDTQRRRLNIKVEAHPRPLTISADSLALERIIANLLSNAVKFTPEEGHITIRIAEEAREVVITVSDTGSGIAAEELPHLFDKYHQTPSPRRREGIGLGLYIVKMLTEAHGGRVTVTSTPGQGSHFSVFFPVS